MSLNPPPYEPLSGEGVPPPVYDAHGVVPDPVRPVDLPPFSFSEALNIGFRSFQQQYLMLLAVAGIFAGISIVNWGIQQITLFIGSTIHPTLGAVSPHLVNIPLQILVVTPLSAGGMFAGVRAARGEKIRIGDLGLGFQRYGTVVLVTLLMWLVIGVALIPLGVGALVAGITSAAGGNTTPQIICLILGGVITLILMVAFSVRFYLATYIAIDPLFPPPRATDCLRTSWRVTQPHAGPFLGLLIVTFLLYAVSFLVLCVGSIALGMPLMIGIFGAAYAMLIQHQRFTTHCLNCRYDMRQSPTLVCPECNYDNGKAPEDQQQGYLPGVL